MRRAALETGLPQAHDLWAAPHAAAAVPPHVSDACMSLPPHWCSICGKDLQSAKSRAEHEAGRKHRRRAGLPVRPRCRWAPLTEEELFDGLAAGTYRRVVVCTGAGVSVPAGIPDFRSKGGLFETIRSRFGGRFGAQRGGKRMVARTAQ